MTPEALKSWRDGHLLTNREAAEMLGLTTQAFLDQIYGHRPVSGRTERLTISIGRLLTQQRNERVSR